MEEQGSITFAKAAIQLKLRKDIYFIHKIKITLIFIESVVLLMQWGSLCEVLMKGRIDEIV